MNRNLTMAKSLVLFLLLLFVAPGCGADQDAITIWEVREEVRIGSQMGGGPDMFGSIHGLSIGPDGRVYVYDSSDQEIRVFAPAGRFVRRIGRAGEGPGEFSWVWGMIWDPDGHLRVIDSGNVRYSIFDGTGAFIEDHPCMVTTRDALISGYDRDGFFYDQTAYVDSTNVYRRILLKMTPQEEIVDRIALPEFNRQALQMGPIRFPIPYSRGLVTCFDPAGYVWYGISDRYEILRLDLNSAATISRLITDEVMPLSQADRDSVNSYLDRLKNRFRMASVPGDITPRIKPIFDGIFLNRVNGDIWVKLIDYAGTGTLLDIYRSDLSSKGTARCTIPLLADPAPVVIGDEIWFVTEDEEGAQFIVRGVLVEEE